MTHFVLVHGVAHGAWCWGQTRADLVVLGHGVTAVDLALTSLDDDAAIVMNTLDEIDGPVVLVGHSYGGHVISKAAHERADVAHLVYVAAMLLGGDEVFTDVSVAFAPSQLGDALVIAEDGRFTVDPKAATGCFYNECTPETAIDAVAQLRATSLGCVTVPSGAEPWRGIPSTYVVCDRDNAIHPEMQRMMAQHAAHTVAIDTDHSPFMSTPAELLVILVAAAP